MDLEEVFFFFLPSMQLIFHLLSRCALDLQLEISFFFKIQICVKSLGDVCPVSTVSVIQLIKGQGILNDLWVDCVICMLWGGLRLFS